MIPLPPHGKTKKVTAVAFKLNQDGRQAQAIIETRASWKGRWLVHPNGFFTDWEGTFHCSYSISNAIDKTSHDLPFLDHQSEDSWTIVPVQNSESWLAHRLLTWSAGEKRQAIVLFKERKDWSRLDVNYSDNFRVSSDGLVVRFETKPGTQVYRVEKNRLVQTTDRPLSIP
jgi:hypothetical protein